MDVDKETIKAISLKCRYGLEDFCKRVNHVIQDKSSLQDDFNIKNVIDSIILSMKLNVQKVLKSKNGRNHFSITVDTGLKNNFADVHTKIGESLNRKVLLDCFQQFMVNLELLLDTKLSRLSGNDSALKCINDSNNVLSKKFYGMQLALVRFQVDNGRLKARISSLLNEIELIKRGYMMEAMEKIRRKLPKRVSSGIMYDKRIESKMKEDMAKQKFDYEKILLLQQLEYQKKLRSQQKTFSKTLESLKMKGLSANSNNDGN